MAFEGEAILFIARDADLGRQSVGDFADRRLAERAGQPVVHQGIDEGAIANCRRLTWQDPTGVAHTFHAARDDDFDVTTANSLGREHDGFQARAAYFVDG